MPSKTIVLSPKVKVTAPHPVMVSVKTSPCRFYAALNLWTDSTKAVQIFEGKVDSVKEFSLGAFPIAGLHSAEGLYCDALAFPGSFEKGEKFSFSLEFSQNGQPCTVTGSASASGEFAEGVVNEGGQIIHIICKFE